MGDQLLEIKMCLLAWGTQGHMDYGPNSKSIEVSGKIPIDLNQVLWYSTSCCPLEFKAVNVLLAALPDV